MPTCIILYIFFRFFFMKCFLNSLIVLIYFFQPPLKAQVFIAPYGGYGVNYINGTRNLSPVSMNNLEIFTIGANLDVAWNHPLYIKGFFQYSYSDNVNVVVDQTQKNLALDHGLETALMLSYRYMNSSIEFGPGFNHQKIVLIEYIGSEVSYFRGNANLITANAQASLYFKYGLSTHIRLSHRLNNLSWYSDEEISRSIYQYLLVDLKLAMNIPMKRLKWKPKIRVFKPMKNSGDCPEISPN